MSLVTHIPAKPPVTETIVLAPGAPEKYIVELTKAQAMFLRACLGPLSPAILDNQPLFRALPKGPTGSAYLRQGGGVDLRSLARDCDLFAAAPPAPSPVKDFL